MRKKTAPPRVEFWTNCQFVGCTPRILELMNAEGWEARQRYLMSNLEYGRLKGGGRLAHLWLRLKMYVVYPLYVAARMLFDREPCIMVFSTNTFYVPALAILLRGRRHRIVHLVYDLFPESLVHAGMLRKDSFFTRVLDRLQGWTLRKSDANVFLGQTLQDYVMAKNPEVAHPVIIDVGASEVPFPDRTEESSAEKRIEILYCGNMGYMHDPSSFIGLIKEPGEIIASRCLLNIHASGKGYADLRQAVGPPPEWVTLGGYLNNEQWTDAMRRADIALINVGHGAEHILMPGRTYSALVAGQAVLAVAPKGSDLARIVETEKCGWLVEPGDVDGLRTTLEHILTHPEELRACQQRAQACGREKYSSAPLMRRWVGLFEEL